MSAPPPVDLTSSLFLGRTHPSRSLPGWPALTTGRPAVLGAAHAVDELARHVAATQGAAAGVGARSTLHALVDVVEVLLHPGDVLALDDRVYPLTRWAARLAASRGVHVISYPHHRPGPVVAPGHGRVWWATDGWCPGCNRPAPLYRLTALASATGGLVIVDDTMAFGVLGRRGRAFVRPGFGDGTGTPGWCEVSHDRMVWLASLAKAHRRAAHPRHRPVGRRHGAAPRRRQPGPREPADVRGRGGRAPIGGRRDGERCSSGRARRPRPPPATTPAAGRGGAGRAALPARRGAGVGRRRTPRSPRGRRCGSPHLAVAPRCGGPAALGVLFGRT